MKNINKKYIDLPIGIGGSELKKDSMELPIVHIDNEVLWVNKNLELPFKIEEGKPTDIVGFFIQDRKNKIKPLARLETYSEHQRSGLMGRVIFKDKQGNLYRDIDQKGGGYVRNEIVAPLSISFVSSSSFGILDSRWAEVDKELSEKFIKYGIRTHCVVAIIKLKEVVNKSEKITIEEAKKRNLFRSIENPVIEIRAFGTKARIHDIYYDLRCGKFLKDAIYLVAQEKGIKPESFTISDYYNWFCVTLGEQVAKMHKNGYAHDCLTPHNITLDCRIVDLDSVVDSSDKEFEYIVNKDKREAIESLKLLLKAINRINEKEKIGDGNIELIKEGFDSGYNRIIKNVNK